MTWVFQFLKQCIDLFRQFLQFITFAQANETYVFPPDCFIQFVFDIIDRSCNAMGNNNPADENQQDYRYNGTGQGKNKICL